MKPPSLQGLSLTTPPLAAPALVWQGVPWQYAVIATIIMQLITGYVIILRSGWEAIRDGDVVTKHEKQVYLKTIEQRDQRIEELNKERDRLYRLGEASTNTAVGLAQVVVSEKVKAEQ